MRMRRIRRLLPLLLAAAALLAPASAEAASWKHCGSWDGVGAWGYKPPGFGHFNVRALNVACRTARRVVRRSGYWDTEARPRGGVAYGEGRFWAWTCYYRFIPPEASRNRCKASGIRRVKWVSAA
jgi:hypothetical protein